MKTKGRIQIFLSRLLGKASRVLHLIPPTLAMYSVEVTDADGRHVSGYKSKSNSWVRNMMNLMTVFATLNPRSTDSLSFSDGQLNMRNTSGTIMTGFFDGSTGMSLMQLEYKNQSWENTSLGDPYGVVVGTSDAAESFDSYDLGGRIAHGSGTGQLQHNASGLVSRTWNSGSRKWIVVGQRTFTNNSGAAITVKEIGHIKRLRMIAGSSAYSDGYFLLIRDVLSTPQVVNNGQTLTVTFTIEFPY